MTTQRKPTDAEMAASVTSRDLGKTDPTVMDLVAEAEEKRFLTVHLPGGTVHFPLPGEFTLEEAAKLGSQDLNAQLEVFSNYMSAEEMDLIRGLKSRVLTKIIEKATELEGLEPGEESSSA